MFGYLQKNIDISRDEIFQKNSLERPFGYKRNEEIWEEMKVEPVEEKLR